MAQAQARMIKRTFKTPEGRFNLCTDRPLSCHFNPARPPRLTLANLTMGLDAGKYIIFNVMDSLHICTIAETNKQALRIVAFGMTTGGNLVYPTCHDFTPVPPSDGYDLLIGLSTGDVVLASVHKQLMASPNNTKVVGTKRINYNSEVDGTRVIGAEWVPQQNGQYFVLGHLSGKVYLYSKASAMTEDERQSESGSHNGGVMPAAVFDISRKGLNALAVSPDGTRLATAARDGTVRIHDLTNGALLAGFRVYYGNPTCCAWSADGACVAAGGEDDLVTVFSLAEQRVVAWCEGHTSWVTTVRFDPWATQMKADPSLGRSTSSADMDVDSASAASLEIEAPPSATTYRVTSLAQDCHICMWDVSIPESPALQSTAREVDTLAAHSHSQLDIQRTRSSSLGAMNGALKSLARLGSSPSRGSPTSYHIHNSSSASSLSLSPEIIASYARRDMTFVPCAASARIHVEPGSDIFFMPNLMFTACYGGQVKAWERLKPQSIPPEPPASKETPSAKPVQEAPPNNSNRQIPAQNVQEPPHSSTARTIPAQQGMPKDAEVRQTQDSIPPRQRAPTAAEAEIGVAPPRQRISSSADAQLGAPQMRRPSEQEAAAASTAAALHP